MESNIIEFSGELCDAYKKVHMKKTAKMLWIIVLTVFIIIFLPITVMFIIFAPLIITIGFITIILFICLMIPIAVMKSSLFDNAFPIKVIIENGEIATLNSEQASKLDNIDGIDSLNVDGYFITSVNSISDAVKVIDYGEWYCIYFNARHLFTDYVCQKDLITKGTIEQFKKLFEGKIQIKSK